MLFEQRFWPLIADGTVTVTFRRWRRRQVVAGHRYRTPVGLIEVDSVTVVEPLSISDDDARLSGYDSGDLLRSDLRGTPDLPTYRIGFHFLPGVDPRASLAASADLSVEDRADSSARFPPPLLCTGSVGRRHLVQRTAGDRDRSVRNPPAVLRKRF